MNSKERVINALNHIQPDKIPLDLGGTVVSGMHVTSVHELREYYGLEKRPVKVYEPYQMLGLIEEDLKEVIGVDVEGVIPLNNFFGFSNEDWKEWRLDNGLEVLVPGKFNTVTDKYGNHYLYPEGDTSIGPSGKMPKDGFYFDFIIRQQKIDENALNPEDNLEEFKLMSVKDLEYFKKAVEKAAETGRAVNVFPGGTALGDIALVPGTFLRNPKGIRDLEEWYISTILRKDYLHKVFDKQTDISIKNLKMLNDSIGNLIDVAFICGSDFGTQCSTFCSKEIFRELYMPYYKRMNGWIHKNTGWKIFKHSCGAIEPFMDLLIEAGFDIINPVQCSAVGMDPVLLKEKYGDRIVFWGGGVDTQHILPFGTPKEVREQVLERCKIFSKNGGFIYNAIHNIQAKTPINNIVAMLNAVHEFNGS